MNLYKKLFKILTNIFIMNNKNINLKSIISEPAKEIIDLFCTPSEILKKNTPSDFKYKWLKESVDLYNNREEFLFYVYNKGFKKNEFDLLNKSVKINYNDMKNAFEKTVNNSYSLNKRKSLLDEISLSHDKEYCVFLLLVYIYKYNQVFDEESISYNLWNYCLRSHTFSLKLFIIGIFTLLCQLCLMGCIVYYLYEYFEKNDQIEVIIISIISTIVSILYCYNTVKSFWHSLPLYKLLLQMHTDFPNLSLNKKQQNCFFNIDKKISMTKLYIKYNLVCDTLSNFILPLFIPCLNTFIILSSESIIEAILNSIAIFYIVQIDEELFTISDYKQNQSSMFFIKRIMSTIYCKYYPNYTDIFYNECSNWQQTIMTKAHSTISKIKINKIEPIN